MSTQAVRRDPTIHSYQMVLHKNPAHWNLYKELALLLSTPAEQSHILLKGAWCAMERKEYKIAQELSQAAYEKYGDIFSFHTIDIELLRRQGQQDKIPAKLLEIGKLFEQKALPAQAVKAYKRLALLEPSQEHYRKVIFLYAQVGKKEKSIQWAEALASLIQTAQAEPGLEKPLVLAEKISDIERASILGPSVQPPDKSQEVPKSQQQPLAMHPKAHEGVSPSVVHVYDTEGGSGNPTRDEGETDRDEDEIEGLPSIAPLIIASPSLEGLPEPPVVPIPRPVRLPEELLVQKLPNIAFGKALWKTIFGVDVGKEPLLPPKIQEVLDSPCPFFSSFFSPQKKGDTHLLVLMPKTINGRPFTRATFVNLLTRPLQRTRILCNKFHAGPYTDPAVLESEWVLMTRYPIPGSQNENYYTQQALLESYSQKTKTPYELPSILYATVCIAAEYFRTGVRLYETTYICCKEKYARGWRALETLVKLVKSHAGDEEVDKLFKKFPLEEQKALVRACNDYRASMSVIELQREPDKYDLLSGAEYLIPKRKLLKKELIKKEGLLRDIKENGKRYDDVWRFVVGNFTQESLWVGRGDPESHWGSSAPEISNAKIGAAALLRLK